MHCQEWSPGGSKDCTGADGESLELRVPVGTQVFDVESGHLDDMVEAGEDLFSAKEGSEAG